MKDNLIYIAVVLLCLVAGFVAGRVTRKSLLDPVVEVKTDTLVVRDTVHFERPVYITQRVVDIFRKERYVTVEVTKTVMPQPKKWHVGVSAGYGACLLNETPVLSPYLGIGITYSIFSF